MKKHFGVLAVFGLALAAPGVASAKAPPPRAFITPMDVFQEVPPCLAGSNKTRGLAIFHVVGRKTGTVRYKLIGNNLPGTPRAAHIHLGTRGTAGPIVQPLTLTDKENGVIGRGVFSNPALVAAMQVDPHLYYVNVHTEVCPGGALRGQLGEHGPPGLAE
jgi:CHRD domain